MSPQSPSIGLVRHQTTAAKPELVPAKNWKLNRPTTLRHHRPACKDHDISYNLHRIDGSNLNV